LLQLPSLSDATLLHGALIASRQGVFIPWLLATPAASSYGHFAEAAIVLFALGFMVRTRTLRRAAFVASAGLLVLGIVVAGWPLHVDMPVASAFSVAGGAGFSPEMASLIIALSVYIAAFIAEVVRGAVGSIDKGQWEAAVGRGLAAGGTCHLAVAGKFVCNAGQEYVIRDCDWLPRHVQRVRHGCQPKRARVGGPAHHYGCLSADQLYYQRPRQSV